MKLRIEDGDNKERDYAVVSMTPTAMRSAHTNPLNNIAWSPAKLKAALPFTSVGLRPPPQSVLSLDFWYNRGRTVILKQF